MNTSCINRNRAQKATALPFALCGRSTDRMKTTPLTRRQSAKLPGEASRLNPAFKKKKIDPLGRSRRSEKPPGKQPLLIPATRRQKAQAEERWRGHLVAPPPPSPPAGSGLWVAGGLVEGGLQARVRSMDALDADRRPTNSRRRWHL